MKKITHIRIRGVRETIIVRETISARQKIRHKRHRPGAWQPTDLAWNTRQADGLASMAVECVDELIARLIVPCSK